MGASATKELATLDFAGGFTPEQLKRTQRRFHRIGSGRVSYQDVASTAGIQLNPLVISLLDHYSGMKGTLSYPELLLLLTSLGSLSTSPESCAAGAAVPRAQLAHVAAATVAMFDRDNDNRLHADEFAALLHSEVM